MGSRPSAHSRIDLSTSRHQWAAAILLHGGKDIRPLGHPRIVQQARFAMRHTVALCAMFVAGLYCWLLLPLGYVWDDTIYLNNTGSVTASTTLLDLLVRSFIDPNLWPGYRPLSVLARDGHLALMLRGIDAHTLWSLGVAALAGLHVYLVGSIARLLTGSAGSAVAACVLAAFTFPLLTASVVLFAGNQVLVVTFWAADMYLYMTYRRGHSKAFLELILVSLVGTYVREILSVAPLVILMAEVAARRFRVQLVALAAVALNALIPLGVPYILGVSDRPYSLFQIGILGQQLAATTGSTNSAGVGVRWAAFGNFLTLFPPSLVILTSTLSLVRACGAIRQLCLQTTRTSAGPAASTLARAAMVIIVAAAAAIVIGGAGDSATFIDRLGLVIVVVHLAAFLSFTTALALWFAATLLPLALTYTEQVHLMYAAVPFAIGSGVLLHQGAVRLKRSWLGQHRLVTAIFPAVVAFGLIDQMSHLYAVRQVTQSMLEADASLGDWFATQAPAGSLVVNNALHGEDVNWHSGSRLVTYWSVRASIPQPNQVVQSLYDLRRLADQFGQGRAFVLSVSYDSLNYGKQQYHSSPFIGDLAPKETQPAFQEVYRKDVHVTYPYLDPLRSLFPREYVPFPTTPDLENGFYHGPDHAGRPLLYEFSAEQIVYSIQLDRLRRASGDRHGATPDAVLVVNGYRGYNVFRSATRFYGVRQADSVLDTERHLQSQYPSSVDGSSLEAVLDDIDQLATATSASARPGPESGYGTVLVENFLDAYQIIEFENWYYAVPRTSGVAFQTAAAQAGAYHNAASQNELQNSLIPKLVQSGVREYNVVQFAGQLYAIKQGTGPFLPTEADSGRYPSSSNLVALITRLASLPRAASYPSLLN